MQDKFLKELELKLSLRYGSETREQIMQCVISSLKDYDIIGKQTELVVRSDDTNESIPKRYVACLRIDGKSEKTIQQYIYTLTKLAETINKPYTEMTTFELRYFLGTIKERGSKNQYIENQRANISAFFTWMFVEEIIGKNPCAKIKPIKVEDVIRLPYTSVEIDKMRAACKKPKERAILELLLSSGIRREELCSLTVDDIDLKKKTVRVRNGKGGKDRVTFMSDVAAEHLERYLSTRKYDTDALFVNSVSGVPTQIEGIKYVMKNLKKRTGIENIHPHRFRRTFATELYRRGMDIYSISKLMGHADIATTKRYIHTADEQLHADYMRYSA